MNILNNEAIIQKVVNNIENNNLSYFQYLHNGICKSGPCEDASKPKDMCCAPFVWCIHASDKLQSLPKHPNCDCRYKPVVTKPLGSISKRQPAPDIWLKLYGKLPDYYIEYEEARKLGWKPGINTVAGKILGKMIGGEIYFNRKHILPEKKRRVWKHCDIDYEEGKRKSGRLYYSSDGLMFYSPNHLDGNVEVYQII